jgi:hypothetical protein
MPQHSMSNCNICVMHGPQYKQHIFDIVMDGNTNFISQCVMSHVIYLMEEKSHFVVVLVRGSKWGKY